MNVLALTHAHLTADGLSPVSCERADSVTGTWAGKMGWNVDVIHTKNTKWRGIWPGGKDLKINIITADAPKELMMGEPQLFSTQLKAHLAKKNIGGAASLVGSRIVKRTHIALTQKGILMPYELKLAEKWADYLLTTTGISSKKYDFIFVCVGYGDEYLLQTGLTISRKLNIPMVVDFRDLWSEHHDPHRFTAAEKSRIRRYEKKLLATTVLISVPQKHMKVLLDRWVHCPTYHLAHSAYVGKDWEDGSVVSNEFRMLYAGKLYPNGPGIRMLLEVIKKVAAMPLSKPFRCHFFVDESPVLKKLADEYGVADNIVINDWVSPWQLWKNTRSAHLLVIIDSATEENYPVLLTKTFQYAYSGQQLLCLLKYENNEMREFLDKYNAGMVTTHVDEAVKFVTQLAANKSIYEALPPLRNVAKREDIAAAYGMAIEKVIAKR